jgi:hypothetical protein
MSSKPALQVPDSTYLNEQGIILSHSLNETENAIKLNALYDPCLLPDYGGSCFKHQKSKLRQLDVHDTTNEFITPWRLYEALKPGTLIMVNVSLHCYVFTNTEHG